MVKERLFLKTAFVVDSTGSLSDKLLDHPDIYQVNLTVSFPDGEEFMDTNDENETKRFYTRMEKSQSLPKTSQPEPGQYIALLDDIVEKNYEHVYFIHLSSKLSGTMQTAQLIAQEYTERIHSHFIDSKGTSYVIENLVIQGLQLTQEGFSPEEIVDKLQWVADHATIYVMVEDLSNLVKGGRLSKGAATLGNVLNVKPILVIDSKGEVNVFKKVRSTKRVYRQWMHLIQEAYEKYSGKISVAFAHGDVLDEILPVKEEVQSHFPDLNYRYGYLTPILGAHGGKGAKGMGIIPIAE